MKIDGGCHCGNITYEGDADPAKAGICHCTDCQTLSGSAFRTTISIPEKDITIKGEPKIYLKTGSSGAKRVQAFCPNCGSPLYSTSVGDGPRILNIRLGTARQRAELMPQKQIWCHSSVNWIADIDDIPKAEQQQIAQ
jgi:hypothetical protein